jgi:hypothetical protein
MGAIEYLPKEHEENIVETDVINAKDAYEKMKKNIDDKDSSIEDLMNILDCKKRTKRVTHRVFIRPPMSLNIRPPVTELIRSLCA